MRLIYLLNLMICAGSIGTVYSQGTYTSVADGDWTDPNTWDCTCVPKTDGWPYDNVIIDHVVEKSGGLVLLGSPADMVVNGTLNITSNNLRTGSWGDASVTISSTGTINIQSGNYRVTGADAFTNNGGTLNAVSFITSGGGSNSITNNGTINLTSDFTHNTTTTFNMTNGVLNVGNELNLGPAVAPLNTTGSTINVTNDMTISGSGTLDHVGDNLIVGGDFNNSGDVDTELDGNITITGNVVNDGSSNLILQGDATIGGNVTGSGGTAITINGTVDITGDVSLSGSAYMDGSGVVGWNTFTTDNSGSNLRCTTGDNHNTDTDPINDPPPPNNPMDLTTCGPGIILPVELLSFNGTNSVECNQLYWATATEENNSHFVVEKSLDGINFIAIGHVAGAGTSFEINEYDFCDSDPVSAYYRLLQVDFDGASAYSPMIYINSGSNHQMSVFPNPNGGNYINLEVGSSSTEDIQYSLYDVTGKAIQSGTLANNKMSLHRIYFSQVLAEGIYVLSVRVDNKLEHFNIHVK